VEAPTPGTNGARRVFRHSYDPALDSDGKIVGVSCVVQDVTDLRFAETTLYEGLEKFGRYLPARRRVSRRSGATGYRCYYT